MKINLFKRAGVLILAAALCLSLAACGEEEAVVSEAEKEEQPSAAPKEEEKLIEGEKQFINPTGLYSSEDGKIYVADKGRHEILTFDGETSIHYAGYNLPMVMGKIEGAYNDGFEEKSLFNHPFAITEWLDGLVVSDRDGNLLRYIKDGAVETLAGKEEAGFQDGFCPDTLFNAPCGLAVGDDGNLYVADSLNGRIRMINEKGYVTTVISSLDTPVGLAFSDGLLYITDAGANKIYTWKDGVLGLFAGSEDGFADGSREDALFSAPSSVAVDEDTVYIADLGNSAVRRIKDGKVDTLSDFEGTGSDLWPGEPSGLLVHNDKLYVADSFSGVVFTLDIK